MEEIEYLEEYEDLVLPALNSATAPAATSSASTKNSNDPQNQNVNDDRDDSSSSLDQDIFNCLFDDNSDDDDDDDDNNNFKDYERIDDKTVKSGLEIYRQEPKIHNFDKRVNKITSSTPKPKTFSAKASGTTIPLGTAKTHTAFVTKPKSVATVRPTVQSKQQQQQQLQKKTNFMQRSSLSFSQRQREEQQEHKPTTSTASTSLRSVQLPVLARKPLSSVTSSTSTLVTKKVVESTTTVKPASTDKKVLKRPATIIKPEKIITKDPANDPLNLDDLSEIGSDNYSLSDISGETYNSVSVFDEDESNDEYYSGDNDDFYADYDDDLSNNSQVIEISNDSSGSNLEDLRPPTPSPVISEDSESPSSSSGFYLRKPKTTKPYSHSVIIESVLTKGEKPKLLQLLHANNLDDDDSVEIDNDENNGEQKENVVIDITTSRENLTESVTTKSSTVNTTTPSDTTNLTKNSKISTNAETDNSNKHSQKKNKNKSIKKSIKSTNVSSVLKSSAADSGDSDLSSLEELLNCYSKAMENDKELPLTNQMVGAEIEIGGEEEVTTVEIVKKSEDNKQKPIKPGIVVDYDDNAIEAQAVAKENEDLKAGDHGVKPKDVNENETVEKEADKKTEEIKVPECKTSETEASDTTMDKNIKQITELSSTQKETVDSNLTKEDGKPEPLLSDNLNIETESNTETDNSSKNDLLECNARKKKRFRNLITPELTETPDQTQDEVKSNDDLTDFIGFDDGEKIIDESIIFAEIETEIKQTKLMEESSENELESDTKTKDDASSSIRTGKLLIDIQKTTEEKTLKDNSKDSKDKTSEENSKDSNSIEDSKDCSQGTSKGHTKYDDPDTTKPNGKKDSFKSTESRISANQKETKQTKPIVTKDSHISSNDTTDKNMEVIQLKSDEKAKTTYSQTKDIKDIVKSTADSKNNKDDNNKNNLKGNKVSLEKKDDTKINIKYADEIQKPQDKNGKDLKSTNSDKFPNTVTKDIQNVSEPKDACKSPLIKSSPSSSRDSSRDRKAASNTTDSTKTSITTKKYQPSIKPIWSTDANKSKSTTTAKAKAESNKPVTSSSSDSTKPVTKPDEKAKVLSKIFQGNTNSNKPKGTQKSDESFKDSNINKIETNNGKNINLKPKATPEKTNIQIASKSNNPKDTSTSELNKKDVNKQVDAVTKIDKDKNLAPKQGVKTENQNKKTADTNTSIIVEKNTSQVSKTKDKGTPIKSEVNKANLEKKITSKASAKFEDIKGGGESHFKAQSSTSDLNTNKTSTKPDMTKSNIANPIKATSNKTKGDKADVTKTPTKSEETKSRKRAATNSPMYKQCIEKNNSINTTTEKQDPIKDAKEMKDLKDNKNNSVKKDDNESNVELSDVTKVPGESEEPKHNVEPSTKTQKKTLDVEKDDSNKVLQKTGESINSKSVNFDITEETTKQDSLKISDATKEPKEAPVKAQTQKRNIGKKDVSKVLADSEKSTNEKETPLKTQLNKPGFQENVKAKSEDSSKGTQVKQLIVSKEIVVENTQEIAIASEHTVTKGQRLTPTKSKLKTTGKRLDGVADISSTSNQGAKCKNDTKSDQPQNVKTKVAEVKPDSMTTKTENIETTVKQSMKQNKNNSLKAKIQDDVNSQTVNPSKSENKTEETEVMIKDKDPGENKDKANKNDSNKLKTSGDALVNQKEVNKKTIEENSAESTNSSSDNKAVSSSELRENDKVKTKIDILKPSNIVKKVEEKDIEDNKKVPLKNTIESATESNEVLKEKNVEENGQEKSEPRRTRKTNDSNTKTKNQDKASRVETRGSVKEEDNTDAFLTKKAADIINKSLTVDTSSESKNKDNKQEDDTSVSLRTRESTETSKLQDTCKELPTKDSKIEKTEPMKTRKSKHLETSNVNEAKDVATVLHNESIINEANESMKSSQHGNSATTSKKTELEKNDVQYGIESRITRSRNENIKTNEALSKIDELIDESSENTFELVKRRRRGDKNIKDKDEVKCETAEDNFETTKISKCGDAKKDDLKSQDNTIEKETLGKSEEKNKPIVSCKILIENPIQSEKQGDDLKSNDKLESARIVEAKDQDSLIKDMEDKSDELMKTAKRLDIAEDKEMSVLLKETTKKSQIDGSEEKGFKDQIKENKCEAVKTRKRGMKAEDSKSKLSPVAVQEVSQLEASLEKSASGNDLKEQTDKTHADHIKTRKRGDTKPDEALGKEPTESSKITTEKNQTREIHIEPIKTRKRGDYKGKDLEPKETNSLGKETIETSKIKNDNVEDQPDVKDQAEKRKRGIGKADYLKSKETTSLEKEKTEAIKKRGDGKGDVNPKDNYSVDKEIDKTSNAKVFNIKDKIDEPHTPPIKSRKRGDVKVNDLKLKENPEVTPVDVKKQGSETYIEPIKTRKRGDAKTEDLKPKDVHCPEKKISDMSKVNTDQMDERYIDPIEKRKDNKSTDKNTTEESKVTLAEIKDQTDDSVKTEERGETKIEGVKSGDTISIDKETSETSKVKIDKIKDKTDELHVDSMNTRKRIDHKIEDAKLKDTHSAGKETTQTSQVKVSNVKDQVDESHIYAIKTRKRGDGKGEDLKPGETQSEMKHVESSTSYQDFDSDADASMTSLNSDNAFRRNLRKRGTESPFLENDDKKPFKETNIKSQIGTTIMPKSTKDDKVFATNTLSPCLKRSLRSPAVDATHQSSTKKHKLDTSRKSIRFRNVNDDCLDEEELPVVAGNVSVLSNETELLGEQSPMLDEQEICPSSKKTARHDTSQTKNNEEIKEQIKSTDMPEKQKEEVINVETTKVIPTKEQSPKKVLENETLGMEITKQVDDTKPVNEKNVKKSLHLNEDESNKNVDKSLKNDSEDLVLTTKQKAAEHKKSLQKTRVSTSLNKLPVASTVLSFSDWLKTKNQNISEETNVEFTHMTTRSGNIPTISKRRRRTRRRKPAGNVLENEPTEVRKETQETETQQNDSLQETKQEESTNMDRKDNNEKITLKTATLSETLKSVEDKNVDASTSQQLDNSLLPSEKHPQNVLKNQTNNNKTKGLDKPINISFKKSITKQIVGNTNVPKMTPPTTTTTTATTTLSSSSTQESVDKPRSSTPTAHIRLKNKRTEIDMLIASMSKEMKEGGIRDLLSTNSHIKRQRLLPRKIVMDSPEPLCASVPIKSITMSAAGNSSNTTLKKDIPKVIEFSENSDLSELGSQEDDSVVKSLTKRKVQQIPIKSRKSLPQKDGVKADNFSKKDKLTSTECTTAQESHETLTTDHSISKSRKTLNPKDLSAPDELLPFKSKSRKSMTQIKDHEDKPLLYVKQLIREQQNALATKVFKTPKALTQSTSRNVMSSLANATKLHADENKRPQSRNKIKQSADRLKLFKCRQLKVRLNRSMVKKYLKTANKNISHVFDMQPTVPADAVSTIQNNSESNLRIQSVVHGENVALEFNAPRDGLALPNLVLNTETSATTSTSNEPCSSISIGKSVPPTSIINAPDTHETIELKSEFMDENPANLMNDVILPDTPTLLARAQTITEAAQHALSNSVTPTDIRLLTTGSSENAFVPSFGVTPTALDNKGTCMYTFLHPAKYNRHHSNVLLDFCCPNLDGPMPAIDPTRIHAQMQVPVIEIPSSIVLTTKIVTKADLECNSSDIPDIIRRKAEKIRNNIAEHQKAATHSPTILPLSPTINVLARQLPASTTITPKLHHTGHQEAIPLPHQLHEPEPLNTLGSPTSETVPNNAMVRVTSKRKHQLNQVQKASLRTHLIRFDILLKQLVQPFDSLTISDRHRIIEAIVSAEKILPRDLVRTVTLMEEYMKHTALIKRDEALSKPSANATTPVPPTASLNTDNYITSQPGATSSLTLPVHLTQLQPSPNILTSSASPSAPTTYNMQLEQLHKKTVRNTNTGSGALVKQCQVPIYDTDRNIIGYQMQMLAPMSTIPPSHTDAIMSTSLNSNSNTSYSVSKRAMKRPAQDDSPRVFYTMPPLQTSTPTAITNSPHMYPSTRMHNTQAIEHKTQKGSIVTTVRSGGSTSNGSETITTTTMATVRRVTRSTATGSKIIIVSKSNQSSEETILPDGNSHQQTEIKNENDIEDFLG